MSLGMRVIFGWMATMGWLAACQSPLPAPPYWADSIPYPEQNPLSAEGVALGESLFFDPILSGNNRIACATCHQPEKAFTDGLPQGGLGATGKPLGRNVPALSNLAWADGLFWDGGAKNLESLPVAPLTHADEMAQDLAELMSELNDIPEYRKRFRKVFGVDSIQTAYVLRALAQYQRSLVSDRSRYDQWARGEAMLSDLEMAGFQVFEKKCATCHPPPFFTDFRYHNTGLDADFPTEWEHPAQGRYRITLDSADLGRFKTPSLRNVAFTAPYTHDGRLPNLSAVLTHYAEQVRPSPTLSGHLQQPDGKLGIPLSEAEKSALLAFLATLTDL